jgi:adenine deaminase
MSWNSEIGVRMSRRDLIDVALGNVPADSYIHSGRIVNVCTGEIYEAGIAVKGDRIAAVGDVEYARGPDTKLIDAAGKYLVPGLVETHVHCFHSYLGVDEYTRLMLSHGVTTIADDFYGLGIVGGRDAVRFFKDAFDSMPIRLVFLVPTIAYLQNRYIGLTPAPGIDVQDMFDMLDWDGCRGLSETPWPAIIEKYPDLLDLFEATLARGKVITGHAADIGARELQAYVAMGAHTDHESTELNDGLAKARSGMKLLIRQGSIGPNVAELVRMFTEHGIDTRTSAFSTDLASPEKLAYSGAIDEHIRVAIANGVPPIQAVQMATINGAEIFGLQHDIGSLSPGRYADVLLVDNLVSFAIDSVIVGGQPVLVKGDFVGTITRTEYPSELYGTVKLSSKLTADDLLVSVTGADPVQVRVMGVTDGKIVTTEERATLTPAEGQLKADIAADVLHLAMVDRHEKGTGIGLGFVKGFRLKAGAIASSVSTECSNLSAVGADAGDMAMAMNCLAEIGGGVVVTRGGKILALVELPICGVMAESPLAVAMEKFGKVFAAIADLGCDLTSPLSQLEFCFAGGLDPELKLSDEGLIRVEGDVVTKVDVVIAD